MVQSTRSGADYGFTLVWAVILANVLKYPFLEYGPRYAVATGESLIAGYQKLGNWAIGIFAVFTVGTMFAIQAAVTIVTASLAVELTGIELSPIIWSVILLSLCISLPGTIFSSGLHRKNSDGCAGSFYSDCICSGNIQKFSR